MEPSTQISHTLPEDDGTRIGPSDTTGEATERCQDASLEAIISEDQQIQPESQEEPIEIDSVTEVSTEVTVTVTRQPPKKRGRPSKSATDDASRVAIGEPESIESGLCPPRKRGRPKKHPLTASEFESLNLPFPSQNEAPNESEESTFPSSAPISSETEQPCITTSSLFCYICGQFTPYKGQRKLSAFVHVAYKAYFGIAITNLEHWWTPTNICANCDWVLHTWYYRRESARNRKRQAFEFSRPVIWSEPTSETHDDCWYCLTKVAGFSMKNRHFIEYPWETACVEKPVAHDEEHPVPESPWQAPPSPEEEIVPQERPSSPTSESEAAASDAYIAIGPMQFTAEMLRDFLQQLEPLRPVARKYIRDTFERMNLLNIKRRSNRQQGKGVRKSYAYQGEEEEEDGEVEPEWAVHRRLAAEARDRDFRLWSELAPRDTDGLLLVALDLLCPVEGCDHRAPEKYHLDEHLLESHGVNKFRCLAIGCAVSFSNRRSLLAHVATTHEDPSSWRCGRCGTSKMDYNHLRNHIQHQHQRGHFRCQIGDCSYEAMDTTRAAMKQHQRSHRQPVHECPFPACGKAFTGRNGLQRHTLIHFNERRYGCTDCEKAFYSRTDLDRHLLTHLGLKSHGCSFCGKAFTLKGGLDKHIKSLHRNLVQQTVTAANGAPTTTLFVAEEP